MGNVGGLVSGLLGGGGSGLNYKPASANIQQPTTTDQTNTAYNNVQTGLGNQQALLSALQGQGGIQNQANVYGQLGNVAAGTGPNPAQTMLANTTGQNVANQAALMAGQRGSNANVGLMARQIAQQGAATQQQSAGQAAALQSQQSLNALGQMGSLATNQVNQQQNATNAYTNAATASQQNLLNSIAAQNNANVNMQSNVNTVGGQLANTTAGGQLGMLGGIGQSIAGAAGSLFSGGSPSAMGTGAGTSVAGGASDAGGLSGMGDGSFMLAAKGGPVKNYADGGDTTSTLPSGSTPLVQSQGATSGPQSTLGKMLSPDGSQDPLNPQNAAPMKPAASSSGSGASSAIQGAELANSLKNIWNLGTKAVDWLGQGAGDVVTGIGTAAGGAGTAVAGGAADAGPAAALVAAEGGQVPALVSPGERYIPPKEVEKVAKGEKSPMKAGEKIPGKPKVGGAKNSYANDTVPKTLEEGGIVLPRSVTQSKDPAQAAHKFVSDILAKRK